jgi:hypothetical protein
MPSLFAYPRMAGAQPHASILSPKEKRPVEPGASSFRLEFVAYCVSVFSLICRFFHFICHPTTQTSIFAALNAFVSMN